MLFPNWKEMTEAMKHMQGGVGFAVPSELYLFCRSREGTELSDSVRDIKNSCIVVVGRVHSLQFRILVKHISLCLPAVVVDELATDANPLSTGRLHGSNLEFRVGHHLLEYLFLLSGLNVEFSVKHLCHPVAM